MRPWIRSILGLCLALLVMPAKAEIVKCVDASGNVTYSEKSQAKGTCVPVTATISVVPAVKQPTPPTPPQAPQVERDGQRGALQKQIAEREAALAEAKKALAEQENIRFGNEANYQRVLDRLKPYQDKVAAIEKEIAQLRETLAKMP